MHVTVLEHRSLHSYMLQNNKKLQHREPSSILGARAHPLTMLQ